MATTAQVYQLYLAYFGRPPDFTGLNSFANSSPAQVQAIFSASAESRALLGSTDTATQVNNIYQNLFGRDAEPAGLAYWVNEIASGRVTLASAAFDILNGARNADATTVANRIEVAQAFVANYSATTAGILGYVGDAAAAQARSFLRTVTDTAASKTAALAGVAAAVANTVAVGGTGATGTSFTLTSNIETSTGTTANDIFNGTLGTTLQTGDIVQGGAGTDTVVALANNPGSQVAFQLDSIENVNIRLLGSANLDATTWSGTNVVSVIDTSLSGQTLTLVNVDLADTFELTRGATLRIDALDDSSTSDTLRVKVNPPTSGATFTVDASAAAITTLALTVSGAAANTGTVAYFGSSTTAFTVAGTGTVVLDLAQGAAQNAAPSSISYAGFSGTTTTLVSAVSNLAFTGNSGADTLTLGGEGSLTGADTINGGAGTDTLIINADNLAATAFSAVSNVEALEATLVSSSIETGIGGFSQLTFVQGTANTDLLVSGINAGATVDFNLTTGRNVRLGYTGGAANLDLQYASGGAQLQFNVLKVSGATSVDLDFGAATATDVGFTSFLNVENAGAVSVEVGKSASVSATTFGASGASTISIQASGDGAILNLAAMTTTGVADLNIDTVGSARVTLGAIGGVANNGDIDINVATSGNLSFGGVARAADGGDADVTISVARSAAATGDGSILLASGTLAVTLAVGVDSDVNLGELAAGGGSVSVNVGVAAGASADISGGISGNSVTSVLASGAASGVITIGTLGGSGIGAVDLRLGVSAVGTLGNIAAVSVSTVSGSVGNYATGNIGSVNASSIGNYTFTVGDGAELNLGSADARGSAGVIGNFGLTGASGAVLSLDEASAGTNVGNLSVTLGDAAFFSALNINALSGSVGNITIVGGSAASASITSIGFETQLGAISLTGSGSVLIEAIDGSGDISSISIGDDTRVTISSIEASGIGSLSVAGDAANLFVSASNVGSVSLTGSAATVRFDSAAANIGDITVRGSGQITVDLDNASSVGVINTTNHAATATIDASNVNSGITITLGASANKVVLSSASDTLTFRNGTGTDSIYFTQTGIADDFGRFFQFGTTTDTLNFGTAGFKLGLHSAAGGTFVSNSAGALDIAVASAAEATRVLILGASASVGGADDATDLVIFADSAFASVTDMLSDLRGFSAAGGVGAGGFTASQSLLVLWYNNTQGRTELSLVNASSNAQSITSAIPVAATALAVFDLNITTVSATTFAQFNTYNDAATP